jgi:hypothetical protein
MATEWSSSADLRSGETLNALLQRMLRVHGSMLEGLTFRTLLHCCIAATRR